MDLLALDKYAQKGKPVNEVKSLVWTERYLKIGDFKAESDDLTLRETLPLGTLVSHPDTLEVMQVLDHEVVKRKGAKPKITVTGNSLDHILDDRVAVPALVGFRNRGDDSQNQIILDPAPPAAQALYLINHYMTGSPTVMTGDRILYIDTLNEVATVDPIPDTQVVEWGSLYTAVTKILELGGCGIFTRRPIGSKTHIEFVIHKGRDVSRNVTFSTSLDEIDEATYFWSLRNRKGLAFVAGKYESVLVGSGGVDGAIGDHRWIFVNAQDVEEGPDLLAYEQELVARGRAAVAAKQGVELTEVQANEKIADRFGKDYFVGDIVGLAADYGARAKMRVDEFTWTFDGTGKKGYPTLTPVITSS